MNSILISVIICNYNYGHFIAEAIESVLNQTYTNFELIIVDDGSTDNSREVINSYTDSRIQTIFQENGGQAAAFNAGFTATKGEIIAFLDSDDWWEVKKLETIIKWHQFLNEDYAVLQHNLNIWDNGKTTPYKLILPAGNCFDEMRRSSRIDFFVPTSGLVFRKEILDKIFPIPNQLRICADAYIMRSAFIFGQVYSIPNTLGFYRKHNNSVFGNKKFKSDVFFKTILFPALNKFYKQHKIDYKISINEFNSVFWLREQVKKIPGTKRLYNFAKSR